MEKENAIGYRRLSDQDQSRYSLEYQEKAIRDYADRYNLNLISIYTDNGQSSFTFDRPDYKELESFLKKHKGLAQYLIIMDHDRFSRNLPHALLKIEELEEKFGIKVRATNEDIRLDSKDPAVFMQRAFNYLMANQELFRIRKRTKEGIREAQKQGRVVNNAPFGYRNAKDNSGKSLIEVDEEKADIVRYIFQEYLKDTPPYIIHQAAKKKGFKNSGNSAITRILSNHIYAGLVKINADDKSDEVLIKGLHQPIVNESVFWLVQEKLGRKHAKKVLPNSEFPLRGILRCPCGRSMTAGFSKGKNKYYLYYRCTKHVDKNYRGETLHQQFAELLDHLSLTEEQVLYIKDNVKNSLNQGIDNHEKVLRARKTQIEKIEKKIESLEARLFEDEIDGATYNKWRKKYLEEKSVVENSIEAFDHTEIERNLKRLDVLIPKLKSLKSIYEMATLKNKHLLINEVFKRNLTYANGQFRTPYINPLFAHNLLKIKEKSLIEIDEALNSRDKIPFST
uniref:recombinase family protein n=1 Tax=uncultured Dysgonomonas sp. TaxID=206096 RepID=UPI0026366E34